MASLSWRAKGFSLATRIRDLSRHPIIIDLQSAYFRVAGTKYRSARLWLNLRVWLLSGLVPIALGHYLLSLAFGLFDLQYGLFDLQSADFLCFFIR